MSNKAVYMSGAGNIFAVLEGKHLPSDDSEKSRFAIEYCSVGRICEGLLAVYPSLERDFEVEFYNPDGTKGMMCGNGARCAIVFAARVGLIEPSTGSEVCFTMAGTDYFGQITSAGARVRFPKPKKIEKKIELTISKGVVIGTYVDVGSDHFVISFDNIRNRQTISNYYYNISHRYIHSLRDVNIDFPGFAKDIRFHEFFRPRGVNVNVFSRNKKGLIDLRTYERGVEAETGACGTGAISTAISIGKFNCEVGIIPPSGEMLHVRINNDDGDILSCELEGGAVFL